MPLHEYVPWLRSIVPRAISYPRVYEPLQRTAGRLFGGFVIALHAIREERYCELVQGLQTHNELVHFAEIIERLRTGRSTAGLFAVTVDDGIGATVRALSAVAIRYGWPVTFFLPTGYIDRAVGMPFLWLDALMAHAPPVRVELRAGPVDLSTPGARSRFARRVRYIMYERPADEYVPLLDELMGYAVTSGWMHADRREIPESVSWDEVAALSTHPTIRFESHGVTHTALVALSPDALERELRESRDRISECTGRECRHFCYPYGGARSIGPEAPAVVARYYDSAVTMSRGRVEGSNLFLVPRIPLYERDSAAMARLKVLTR